MLLGKHRPTKITTTVRKVSEYRKITRKNSVFGYFLHHESTETLSRIIKIEVESLSSLKPKVACTPSQTIFIYWKYSDITSLLWIFGKNFSPKKKEQLVEIFQTCHNNIKLNVVFKSSNQLQNAFLLKIMFHTHFISSKVIYKYKCNICNGIYIEETKYHLFISQYDYEGKSVLSDKLLKYDERHATVIRKH